MISITGRTCRRASSRSKFSFRPGRLVLLGLCIVLVAWIGASLYCATSASVKPAPAKPVSPDEVALHGKRAYHKEPLSYLVLVPCAAVFVIAAFTKGKKIVVVSCSAGALLVIGVILLLSASAGPDKATVQKGIDAYEKGRYADAAALFESAREESVVFPLLEYDLALAQRYGKNPPLALDTLYGSLRTSPGEKILIDAIREIEKEGNLLHQFDPVPQIDPDVPFVIALAFFSACIVLFGFFLRARKSGILVAAMCSAALFVAAAALAIYCVQKAETDFSVVALPGAGIKKIPDPDLSAWSELAPGTTVRVYGEANGFVLVETGTGFKGWVQGDALVADSREKNGGSIRK